MVSDFNYTEEEIGNARVGDVLTLRGKRVRITKRTNFNISVVPYTRMNALEDRVEKFILWIHEIITR